MENRILLVDDDPGLIRVMARILAGLGQFRFATNGADALQQVREWDPDLVILDAEMPGLNGFQVCEAMKSEPCLRDIPVIFVTSHSDHDFEVKGLELGAVDFIAKPVNEVLVAARVKTQLRLKGLTDELRLSAMRDPVTGLPNRRNFDEMLQKEWRRGLWKQQSIAMLLVQVDHLDKFTDRYGHTATDACLRQLAQALRGACGSPADELARYSHDSFVLLMPETPRADALERSQSVIRMVEKLAIRHDSSPLSSHVTVSIGVSVYDESCDCWPALSTLQSANEPVCSEQDLAACARTALLAATRNGGAQSWYAEIECRTGELETREIIPGHLQNAASATA